MKKITHGLTNNLQELAKEYWTIIDKKFNPQSELLALANKENCPTLTQIIAMLVNEFESIVLTPPEQLKILTTELKNLIDTSLEQAHITQIKEIFIRFYDEKVRQSKTIQKWMKNNLLLSKVCPYCNINYLSAITVVNSQGTETTKLLLQLDHFYNKATYFPFALSFYNLIPVCQPCNAGLKVADKTDIIHPYQHDFHSLVNFSLDISNRQQLQNFINPDNRKEFIIKPIYSKTASPDEIELAKSTVKLFELKARYEEHQDYICEILQKAYTYPKDYFNILINQYGHIFKSYSEVHRLIWGNYTAPADINRRPLAKLTQDLIKDLGIEL